MLSVEPDQGFFWWELDLSFYVLKVLSWAGVVWDLQTPPKRLLERRRGDVARIFATM